MRQERRGNEGIRPERLRHLELLARPEIIPVEDASTQGEQAIHGEIQAHVVDIPRLMVDGESPSPVLPGETTVSQAPEIRAPRNTGRRSLW